MRKQDSPLLDSLLHNLVVTQAVLTLLKQVDRIGSIGTKGMDDFD